MTKRVLSALIFIGAGVGVGGIATSSSSSSWTPSFSAYSSPSLLSLAPSSTTTRGWRRWQRRGTMTTTAMAEEGTAMMIANDDNEGRRRKGPPGRALLRALSRAGNRIIGGTGMGWEETTGDHGTMTTSGKTPKKSKKTATMNDAAKTSSKSLMTHYRYR